MKKFLISACLLGLAACGGSGGEAPNTQSTNTNVSPMPETQTSGKQFYSWKNTAANAVAFDADNIKKLKINGLEVNLANVNGINFNDAWRAHLSGSPTPQNSGLPDDVDSYAVYNQSDNLVAGIISRNGNNFAFYNGHFTDMAQMPVSGQAVYRASVVTFDGHTSQSFGGSRIVADFGAKTVSGNISRYEKSDIVLNAGISGNKFASAESAAVKVEGGFFGPRAAEIGGIFKTGDTVGVFAGQQ